MSNTNRKFSELYARIVKEYSDHPDLKKSNVNRLLANYISSSEETKSTFFKAYESSLEEHFQKDKFVYKYYTSTTYVKIVGETNERTEYGFIYPLNHIQSNRKSYYTPPEPPRGAQYFISLFLSKYGRETIIGDLDEEFSVDIFPKFGAHRA